MLSAFPSTAFVLASIVVGCMMLLGLGLLFVRAENIEREWLVALITVVTTGISIYLLVEFWRTPSGRTGNGLVPIVCLSLLGYGVGRVIDYFLGGRSVASTNTDATLGADLAD